MHLQSQLKCNFIHEFSSKQCAESYKYVLERPAQLSEVHTVSVALSCFLWCKNTPPADPRVCLQSWHIQCVHCVMDVMFRSSSCFRLMNPVRNETNHRWSASARGCLGIWQINSYINKSAAERQGGLQKEPGRRFQGQMADICLPPCPAPQVNSQSVWVCLSVWMQKANLPSGEQTLKLVKSCCSGDNPVQKRGCMSST